MNDKWWFNEPNSVETRRSSLVQLFWVKSHHPTQSNLSLSDQFANTAQRFVKSREKHNGISGSKTRPYLTFKSNIKDQSWFLCVIRLAVNSEEPFLWVNGERSAARDRSGGKAYLHPRLISILPSLSSALLFTSSPSRNACLVKPLVSPRLAVMSFYFREFLEHGQGKDKLCSQFVQRLHD